MNLHSLKYPIGEYVPASTPGKELLNQWIEAIEAFPARLERLTKGLTHEKLHWHYRPGGWTVKQVIHHCADSHMNSLLRFKLALTEKAPVICPYDESKWADLADSLATDTEPTLLLLRGLHQKWALLLRSLTRAQLESVFIHPQHGKEITLAESTGHYAWHCRHHLAHIRQALESGGKYNN